MQNELRVERIGDHKLSVPEQAHTGDAGFDLRSTIEMILIAGSQHMIPCGFAFEIPRNMVGIVKDKSSVAINKSYISAGVIDSSYRGEVRIVIRKDFGPPLKIRVGDKIAQLVILPYYKAKCVEMKELSNTTRGDDGFGSTGKQ